VSRLRSSIVLLALGCAFGVGVPCASAIDPFPNTGIATLHSAHFMIHYSRDDHSTLCPTAAITQEKAGDVLGWAERAYGFYTSWGYLPPAFDSGGNSHYNISVDEFDTLGNSCVSYDPISPSVPIDDDGTYKRWDALINPDTPTTGFIHLESRKGLSFHVVAHEVFHLFEREPTRMDPNAEQWLQEGTAEWAAFRAENFLTPTDRDRGVNPDRTADCVGSECGDTELDKNGYPGWLLFEYFAEQYGQDAVRQLWAKPGTGIGKFAAYLPATRPVDKFWNDFATARLSGNFTLAAIQDKLPTAQASFTTGDVTSSLPTVYLAVNHLAARYVTIHHADPANVRAPCYAATLTLTITIPTGVPSTPYFYANTYGASPRAFTVSGSKATLIVDDWNTCASSPDAWISLPNDSWNPGHDGTEFAIDADVTVDFDTPASPASPSNTKTVSAPVVEAPTTDPPPTLKLYAPEVLRLSARTRVLRFVVFASGSGQLQATLGSADLGTVGLRAGNNDVRFTLPKSLLTASRQATSRTILALTSLSLAGDSGDTITRRVVIQAPKKKPKRR
jgi:hypothetical protein